MSMEEKDVAAPNEDENETTKVSDKTEEEIKPSKSEEDRKAEEEWEKAAKEAEEAALAEKKQKEAEKAAKEAEKKQKAAEKEAKKDAEPNADKETPEADSQYEELHPHRRKIHKLFFFVSVVAMIAAVSMATGQIVGLVFKKLGPVQWVFRGYTIALCFLVLFTELEMTKLARENFILHNWVCRGLLYSFIGVIGLEEDDKSVYKDDPPLGAGSAKYFMRAVSWIILGVGAVYFFMGALCIQRQYEFERVEFKERSAQSVLAQRDLREKRRNEIRERRQNKKLGRDKPHPAEDKA